MKLLLKEQKLFITLLSTLIEDNLMSRQVDKSIQELRDIIEKSPKIAREYVLAEVELIETSLE